MNITVNKKKVTVCFVVSEILTALAVFPVVIAIAFTVFFMKETAGESLPEHILDILICAAFCVRIISRKIWESSLRKTGFCYG